MAKLPRPPSSNQSPYYFIEQKLRDGMVRGNMHKCLRDTGRLAGGLEAGDSLTSAETDQLGRYACELAINGNEATQKWIEAVNFGRKEPIVWKGHEEHGLESRHQDVSIEQPIPLQTIKVNQEEIKEPSSDEWNPVEDLNRYLSTLFEPDEIIGYVTEWWWDDNAKRYKPKPGNFNRTVGEIQGNLEQHNGDSIFITSESTLQAGVLIRINPLDGKGITDANVSGFRYALVESDDLPIEEQHPLLKSFELPIAALVHSGNKSLHAIVRVDAEDRVEYDRRVGFLYDYCGKHGFKIDQNNKNPSRLSRMPGAWRSGKKQWLIATNIGKRCWDDWFKWVEDQEEPFKEFAIRSLGDLQAYKKGEDPNELLQDRFWCKGGGLLVVGQAGLGKSTLTLQFGLCLAAGLPFFGLLPKEGRRFSSWLIQAENDDGDLSEQRDGIIRGMAWDEAVKAETVSRVKILTVDSLSGESLVKMLTHKLETAEKAGESPDYLILDPALAYIGGDNSKGQDVSIFLREQITPMIHRFNIGIMIVHHTNKPREENGKPLPSDAAYLATGSAEWANWPRAIIALQATRDRESFKLTLAKRGGRAGWTNSKGEKVYEKNIQHSSLPGCICWEEAPMSVLPASEVSANVRIQNKLKGFISIFPTVFDPDNPEESYLWTAKINSRRKSISNPAYKFSNDDVYELKDNANKLGHIMRWKQGQKECVMLTSLYEESHQLREYFTDNEAVYKAYKAALKNAEKEKGKMHEFPTLL